MTPGDGALADATLLAVLRRAASPLRHDMAGALLVPRMRLQMLRRRAGTGALAGAELQAGVDAIALGCGVDTELAAEHVQPRFPTRAAGAADLVRAHRAPTSCFKASIASGATQ